MEKILALLLTASMAMFAAACSSGAATSSVASVSSGETSNAAKVGFKVLTVTDTGGVNDWSFSQLSQEGLQKLKADNGADISYVESKQETDYATGLDKAVDDEDNLAWGVGFTMGGAILNAAKASLDVQFAIVDSAYEEAPSSLTAAVLRTQEPPFLVGYIAAKIAKTNKVDFVGGVRSDIINRFEYDCEAGVAYGVEEMGKTVEVVAQYAKSFVDSARSRVIASKMFSGGCDTVFHTAGNAGTGVIEVVEEASKYAIGVDKDQAFLAPNNVLISTLKKVDKAVEEVSKETMDNKTTSGTTINLGVEKEATGIPEEHKLMGEETYKAAATLQDQIKDGRLVPPASEEDYNTFVKNLK